MALRQGLDLGEDEIQHSRLSSQSGGHLLAELWSLVSQVPPHLPRANLGPSGTFGPVGKFPF